MWSGAHRTDEKNRHCLLPEGNNLFILYSFAIDKMLCTVAYLSLAHRSERIFDTRLPFTT